MRSVLFAATLVSTVALRASAQQPAKAACEVDEGKPKNVALAAFGLQRAFSATNPAEKAKLLKDVVKGVTSDEKNAENPGGKAWILGRAMILFASQTELPASPTRADLGFTSNPTGAADVLALADSAFTVVEQSVPTCAGEVAVWRAQSPWFKTVQAAFSAMQAQQWDSAAKLANRAAMINHVSAYSPYILATVAMNQKNAKAAYANWTKAIELAGTDTGYTEIRRRSLFDMGRFFNEIADTAKDAGKREAASIAAKAYRQYINDVPNAPEGAAVRNSLAEMMIAAGDSTKVPEVYADLIANPSKYDDIALVQAGIIPTRMGRNEDAAKLFEAALAANPYQRDALSNLAAMLYQTNQHDRIRPFVDRLVALDPNNPDNWLLYAFAYQGLIKAVPAKDLKTKKALTDSLVKYNEKSEKMPVRVAFTGFTRGEAETQLNGTIENRGAAAKSYTINVEFLDKSGQVVATQSASVANVAPKGTGTFSIKVPKGGIYGFRYAPIT